MTAVPTQNAENTREIDTPGEILVQTNTGQSSLHSSTPRYFRSIDGLRFLAAIGVVLFHYEKIGGFSNLNGSPGWFFQIIKGPAFHATLFFILAGFIFSIKFGTCVRDLSLSKFLKSRLRDLYPLHAITTIAMVPLALQPLIQAGEPWVGTLVRSLAVHLGLLYAFFPFETFALNRPSWALSAFFFCYLLLPPTLALANRLHRKRTVLAAMGLCLAPIAAWGGLFALLGNPMHLSQFFHTFPPVRFFEFAEGVLMGRLFQLGKRTEVGSPRIRALGTDLLIISVMVLIFLNTGSLFRGTTTGWWFSYHLYAVPLFMLLLYGLAREEGMVAAFFALPFVRKLGQSSFYPYLLHIPLASWMCYVLGGAFGYKKSMHSPVNVFTLVASLYVLSAIWWNLVRKKRRKAYRVG